MVTVSAHVSPRLGEMSAAFAMTLGTPHRVESHGAGVVRWYRRDESDVIAVFDRNHAIAVLCPYTRRTLRRRDLDALLTTFSSYPADARVFVADSGLIIARTDCPRRAVELLAALTSATGSLILATPAPGG
jgi:hypothetical protein